MQRIRVLIADDEPMVRDALADVIAGEASLELVGAAEDADQAIALARLHGPDVALLDVKMPAGGGVRAAARIRACSPRTHVVGLSAYDDRGSVLHMIRSGAVGYLVKGTPVEEILATIHRVVRGQGALSSEVAAEVVRELADHLDRQQREWDSRSQQGWRIRRVLDGDGLSVVFQPIVDLGSGQIVGQEALARFSDMPCRPPDQWFAEATAVGLGADLELAAARAALADLERLPTGVFLSLNLSPAVLITDGFLAMMAAVPAERIVIEVTEHARVDDYDALCDVLRLVRQRGSRLAIDDTGAGFASLQHILRLAPDLIKIDMSLTRGIDGNQAQHALAGALISFAAEIHASIIAEGIETAAEAAALRPLGAHYGQGYYLGPPAPLV